MKYIKTYESFTLNKRSDAINEEFLGIGKLFQGLKNKLSLGFSKMFGSAAKVEKLMEEYKGEIMVAWSKKKDALLAVGKFQKAIKDGGEEDKAKFGELIKTVIAVSDNYQKQKDLIKKKFDIRFSEIVKEEKNDKIKNFINLKKIEMEQDLLQQESSALLTDAGLTEEDIKGNKELEEIMKGITDKVKQSQDAMNQQTEALKSDSSGEPSKFDFEAAKKDAENYKWENSKYTKDYKFVSGEEIKVWMNESKNEELSTFKKNGDSYEGTTLFVASDEKQKENTEQDKIAVTANKDDLNSGFTVLKSKIISTKKDEEESAKKQEEESKKEATEENV